MSIHIDFNWVNVRSSPDVVSRLSMAELYILISLQIENHELATVAAW